MKSNDIIMTFSLLCKNKVVEKPLDHMKNHELEENHMISTPNNGIKEILSEFAMATTELSGQTYPTAAHVCILFLSLISYLNSQILIIC